MWKILLISAIFFAHTLADTDKVVCYHGSWAHYRTGTCKFSVDDINATLCTHVIYGFVGINTDGTIRIMDSWLDVDLGALKKFSGLRSKNPNLKSLVAIGGWNEGSTKFSTVASSPTLRAKFIQSAITFLQTYGFDGFDLDWEYPAQRGGAASDKVNFSKLLAEFRAAFNPHGFLLTAAVAACEPSTGLSYEVPELNKYLDFINVMTYDMHGAWETATGQNAPLFPSPKESQQTLNVDSCIRDWIRKGADPRKLILGVGTYGRSFTLASSSNNNLGAAAYNGGTAGRCTGEAGILGYFEICEKIKAGGWTVVWDEDQKVPYAYNGNQWVGYDNEQSIAIKVQYAKGLELGGIMVWSLETDDFKGTCGRVNPIMNTILETLDLPIPENPMTPPPVTEPPVTQPSVEPPVTEPPVTQPPVQPPVTEPPVTQPPVQPPVTEPPSPGSICINEGFVRDSSNCGIFYQCVKNGQSFIAYAFLCPAGLYFDTTVNVCNYPQAVQC